MTLNEHAPYNDKGNSEFFLNCNKNTLHVFSRRHGLHIHYHRHRRHLRRIDDLQRGAFGLPLFLYVPHTINCIAFLS